MSDEVNTTDVTDEGVPELPAWWDTLSRFFGGNGLIVLILWAISATVVSATLTNLAVDASNATVSYRLAVGLSLYNPGLRVSIYYDTLDVELRFRGVVLGGAGVASPAEFWQRRKSGDNVTVEFDGGSGAVSLDGDVLKELQKEKDAGAVSLEMAVNARVRYKFASIKNRQKPKIWCSLTIPVKPEGTGAGVGGMIVSGDRCSVKY